MKTDYTPHALDHFSARMRFPGGRITKSFGAWLEECERHDSWHELPEEQRKPTLANVAAFLDDYTDFEPVVMAPETMKAADTLTAIDWNSTRTEFAPGDRVLFHDDDGELFKGTISTCSEQSLHINFDDGQAGWEAPEQCEIIK